MNIFLQLEKGEIRSLVDDIQLNGRMVTTVDRGTSRYRYWAEAMREAKV